MQPFAGEPCGIIRANSAPRLMRGRETDNRRFGALMHHSNSCSSRALVWLLIVVFFVPTPSAAAMAEGEPPMAPPKTVVIVNSASAPGPLLASGLRLAAAAEAQPSQRLPRGFRCVVGIPLATAAGAMAGLTVALVAALADLGTPPQKRTGILLTAGAGIGLAFGIYGCTR